MIFFLCFLIASFMVCGLCGLCQLYSAARTFPGKRQREYQGSGLTMFGVGLTLAVLSVAIHWSALIPLGVMLGLIFNQLILRRPNPEDFR